MLRENDRPLEGDNINKEKYFELLYFDSRSIYHTVFEFWNRSTIALDGLSNTQSI